MRTWQYLWRLFRFRHSLFFSMFGLRIVVFAVIPNGTALLTRSIFDSLTGDAVLAIGVYALCALLVALALGQVVAQFGDVILQFATTFTMGALLRKNLLAHILDRPGNDALPGSPGEAVSRFRDDVDFVSSYLMRFPFLVALTAFAGIALFIMVRIKPLVTLAVFLPLATILIAASLARHRLRRYREASREAAGEVTSFVGELFGTVESVKVANGEDRMTGHFQELNNLRRTATLRDILLGQALNSVFRNANNLGTGLILILAAQSMLAGSFTVGDFALFVYYLGLFGWFNSEIGTVLTGYRRVEVSTDRLQGLMRGTEAPALVAHGPVYLRGRYPDLPFHAKELRHRLEVLEARGLTYVYGDSGRGVKNIDLRVERGSFTVITGRIGSGKSTLLRVLLGLLPLEAGKLLWNGEVVAEPDKFFVPPRCGYTAQVPRLFSEPLRDNILMGLPEEKVDLAGAIRSAVMEQDVGELESGLDTVVGPRGVRLSGGQLRRSAAARMFVRDPELLVLDDLSSGLDVETELTLWERLEEIDGTTIVAVSHRRAALRRAGNIVVLRDGAIEAEGKLGYLLETCEEMRRLWHGDIGDRGPPDQAQG